MTDPLLVSNIMAKMDLATLKNFVPMAEGESYNGKLDADVHLDGRMSALEREDYEAFKAEGLLTLKNMLYKSKNLSNDVAIDEMIFRFSPKNLALEKLIAKTGKSDFQMNGTIDNYMGYIFRDELSQSRQWPLLADMKAFRNRVRAIVNELIDNKLSLEDGQEINFTHQFWVILMGIEHDKIHLETTSCLIR